MVWLRLPAGQRRHRGRPGHSGSLTRWRHDGGPGPAMTPGAAVTGRSCMTDQQMASTAPAPGRRFRAYTTKHLDDLVARAGLEPAERLAVRAVATVLPFRTNEYVIESLIDWSAAPADPIYRLVFPQADMLSPDDIAPIADLLARQAPQAAIQIAAHA